MTESTPNHGGNGSAISGAAAPASPASRFFIASTEEPTDGGKANEQDAQAATSHCEERDGARAASHEVGQGERPDSQDGQGQEGLASKKRNWGGVREGAGRPKGKSELPSASDDELKKLLLKYSGGARQFCKKYIKALEHPDVTPKQKIDAYNDIMKLLLRGGTKELDSESATTTSTEDLERIAARAAAKLK